MALATDRGNAHKDCAGAQREVWVEQASVQRHIAEGGLSWCEIDTNALEHNARVLGARLSAGCTFAPVVKGNAYGHGMLLAARAFVSAGAHWLCVFDAQEALELRRGGVQVPLLVLGRVFHSQIDEVAATGARLVVFDAEGIVQAAAAGQRIGRDVPVHLELETGNWRQGALLQDAGALVGLASELPGVRLEGIATHFSDVEDTTDHTYARAQLAALDQFVASVAPPPGAVPLMVHCGNSAATILWPHAHRSLVRVGIAAYGMWPSKETWVSAQSADSRPLPDLRPALTWKARVVQVKQAPAGADVGYGRTFRTTHATCVATIGVGYADGYDRKLSNRAHALAGGTRAPVRGRVCMNLIMLDVTHSPPIHVGDAVTLLGSEGADRVSAEQMAEWAGTINYEITTRIAERLPRLAVPRAGREGTA